jgi:hypothetical protein
MKVCFSGRIELLSPFEEGDAFELEEPDSSEER